MNSNIEALEKNLQLARRFVEDHPDMPENSHISAASYGVSVSVDKSDAAKVGEVLGKTGWVLRLQYEQFAWEKSVSGVIVTISGMEELEINKSPVNPKEFPIMLEDEK